VNQNPAPIAELPPAKPVFYVAEEHGPLYDLWQAQGYRNLAVCHVDFHCDMCELLIDRHRARASYVWQNDPFINRLDSGSFLAHAKMNGIVSSLRWVHGEFGGRRHDMFYCVKYESEILDREFTPIGVFVAQSIAYCHPDKTLFDEFIARLEKKFATEAVWLSTQGQAPTPPSLAWRIYHQMEHVVLRGCAGVTSGET
jgi:hypothetical protein